MLTYTFPHVLGIEIDILRGLGAKVAGLQVGFDLMAVGRDLGQELGVKIGRYKETAAHRNCECGVEEGEDKSGGEGIHYPVGGELFVFGCFLFLFLFRPSVGVFISGELGLVTVIYGGFTTRPGYAMKFLLDST